MKATPRCRVFALGCALFLFVWLCRAAVVEHFGSDLPQHDQWEAEGREILLPWFQHRLHLADFFRPHNDHTIACTRALALLMVVIDGRWEARPVCLVNAAIHAWLAVGIFFFAAPLLRPTLRRIWLGFVALLFAAPVSWNNILAAFHSVLHFLTAFSLVAIASLLSSKPRSGGWWVGIVAGFLATVSMATGWLTWVIIAGVMVFDARRRGARREGLPTFAGCAAGIIVGVILFFHRVDNPALHAGSMRDALLAGWRSLMWPVKLIPLGDFEWLFPVMAWSPWCWLAARVAIADNDSRGEWRVIVAAGAWVLAQLAATAWGRGMGGAWPASRYTDIIALGWLINALATLVLWGPVAPHEHARGFSRLVARLGAVGCAWGAIGVAIHVGFNFADSMPRFSRHMHASEHVVAAYLQSGNILDLTTPDAPHPSPVVLAGLLDQPEIRAILPTLPSPPARHPADAAAP